MAQELKFRQFPQSKKALEPAPSAPQMTEEVTRTAVLEGVRIESIAKPEQEQEDEGVSARIYRLPDHRAADIVSAELFAKISVGDNHWEGVGQALRNYAKHNGIGAEETTFLDGLEEVKRLSGSRVKPLVTHPDGSWEGGYYVFHNGLSDGLLIIERPIVADINQQTKRLGNPGTNQAITVVRGVGELPLQIPDLDLEEEIKRLGGARLTVLVYQKPALLEGQNDLVEGFLDNSLNQAIEDFLNRPR